MADPFVSMEGALFVLEDGANSTPLYLGCHMLDDVDVPRGGNELLRCPDPSGPNLYANVGLLKSPPELVSFSIDADITPVIDYLETVDTGFAILVNQMKSGRKNEVTNWDRSWVIEGCDITNETLAGLASKDENVRSTQAMDIEALNLYRIYLMAAYRQSISEVGNINRTFANPGDCDTIFGVADAGSGVSAQVWYDDGAGWTATAADPLAADIDIKSGLSVPAGRSTNRIMVFSGSTGVAGVVGAYSDDGGATWVDMTVSAIVGEFVASPGASFGLDINNLWVGTDGGYIYYSDNGGTSWVAQEQGVIHTGAWNWVQMVDAANGFAGGDAGVTAVTADGGATWSLGAIVGGGAADITDGAALSALKAWVTASDGSVYYTDDGGATWTGERNFGAESLTSISFLNEFQGFLVYGTTTSVVYMTKDGGATWEAIQTPSNSGLNSIHSCSSRLVYASGNVNAATGMVMKLQPRT